MHAASATYDWFELPGGLVLEDGRRLTRAALRPLTGREEDWLASHTSAASAIVVTGLLGACLAQLDDMPGNADLARRLLVGDREYLMLQLRRMTLGDTIRAVFVCPACSKKMDVVLSAGEIVIERRPQEAASYTLAVDDTGTGGRMLRFRLPTGADQEAVLDLDVERAAETILHRCIVDDGGAALLPAEQEAVIAAMDRLAPQLELELELTCPECGHAFVEPFDLTTFFRSEMRIGGAQLLREVHHLALHYHWSEAEILSLTRARRHTYLALLSEALRPD
jgi:hypothetical protein